MCQALPQELGERPGDGPLLTRDEAKPKSAAGAVLGAAAPDGTGPPALTCHKSHWRNLSKGTTWSDLCVKDPAGFWVEQALGVESVCTHRHAHTGTCAHRHMYPPVHAHACCIWACTFAQVHAHASSYAHTCPPATRPPPEPGTPGSTALSLPRTQLSPTHPSRPLA